LRGRKKNDIERTVRIGIGLPSTVPGVTGQAIAEWATTAEARGFTSLAVIDRLVYPSYEPIVALTAAAAVTSQISLLTSSLITPLRTTAVAAKQLASLDHLSGGRLSVGVVLGGREDDYLAVGKTIRGRGAVLDSQLQELKRIWEGEVPAGCKRAIGPRPLSPGGLSVFVGAFTERAMLRAVDRGDGWISGGLPPDAYAGAVKFIRNAWNESGRQGEPRFLANVYFSLGPDGREVGDNYILDYYEFMGDQAAAVAASVATDEDSVRGTIAAYAEAGCDELLFFPCSTDPAQVGLLADHAGTDR
jgi:alkanesulfonate monooxygenase SsuD/methylene tetrahydromethanopterin reductase-like flavin-dependent oxidoreductase (luciferase family)